MFFVPENAFWRVLPFVVVAGLSLWGLVSPRTNWKVLWGWQDRYRHVEERDREDFVRRRLIVPFVVSVLVGLLMWFA